jgi:hypothetical protein
MAPFFYPLERAGTMASVIARRASPDEAILLNAAPTARLLRCARNDDVFPVRPDRLRHCEAGIARRSNLPGCDTDYGIASLRSQ